MFQKVFDGAFCSTPFLALSLCLLVTPMVPADLVCVDCSTSDEQTSAETIVTTVDNTIAQCESNTARDAEQYLTLATLAHANMAETQLEYGLTFSTIATDLEQDRLNELLTFDSGFNLNSEDIDLEDLNRIQVADKSSLLITQTRQAIELFQGNLNVQTEATLPQWYAAEVLQPQKDETNRYYSYVEPTTPSPKQTAIVDDSPREGERVASVDSGLPGTQRENAQQEDSDESANGPITNVEIDATAIPEPGSISMFLLMAFGVTSTRRRKA